MDSFLISFNAVFPFAIYLGFGYAVRRSGLADLEFLRKLNRVAFRAFYPLLMFNNMYSIGDSFPLSGKYFMLAVVSLAVTIAAACIAVPRLVSDRKKIPVLIQGIYRSNILLFAVPLVQNLFGDADVVKAAALVVIVVPVYNISATILLELYSGKENTSPLKFLIAIITTPLIFGAWVGFLFKLLNIPIAAPLMKVIKQFADMTTPLALFILGGTLQFKSLGKHLKLLWVSYIIKQFLIPAAMLAAGIFIGLSPIELFLGVALYATPVATAAFPMAQAYGADADLAGEQVVFTTVGALFSCFFWILFMQYFNLL